MPGKTCRVMFKDADGVMHAVEVSAAAMYEAAVLELKALKRSDWIELIGPGTRITIQVIEPAVEHFIFYAQLQRWLDGGAKSSSEAVMKRRLREMLAG